MSIAKNGLNSADFSEKAASKAALSETAQHPLTIWPPALSVATGAGLVILGMVPVPVAVVVVSAGVVVGVTNWAVRFFGGKTAYIQNYYARLHEEFEKLKEKKVESLKRDLRRLGCTQGFEQVSQFEEKFQTLMSVLKRILSEGELAYGRYLGAAETVYRSGIEHLDEVVTILTSIENIDRQDLERRMQTLASSTRPSDARLLTTYRERAKVYDDGERAVEDFLVCNEEALTALDKTAGAVRMINVSDTSSDHLKDAMADLLGLIGRLTKRSPLVALEV